MVHSREQVPHTVFPIPDQFEALHFSLVDALNLTVDQLIGVVDGGYSRRCVDRFAVRLGQRFAADRDYGTCDRVGCVMRPCCRDGGDTTCPNLKRIRMV